MSELAPKLASSDCDVCHRPAEDHTKEGYHPPDWFAERLAYLERDVIRLRQQLTEKNKKDERWEVGFRNVAGIAVGARTEYEIKDIVEWVRAMRFALSDLDQRFQGLLRSEVNFPDGKDEALLNRVRKLLKPT